MSRFSSTFLAMSLLALLAIAQPVAANKQGIVLAPQNEQQRQAAELMIQGSQLLKQKQPFKARPLLVRALQMWPASPHGHFNLGLCYGECGEFNQAIEEYKEAYRVDRRLTECLPNIASCYQMMNQPSQAVPWFEEYLRREPHANDAAQIQGMINALKKHSDKQIISDPQSGDYMPSICPEGKLQRWPRARVPIKIFISNGCDEQGRRVRGFREYYNEILVDSIDAWIKASNGHLAYQIVENVQDANIVCTWTDRTDFLKESGNAVEQGAARISARPINDREDEIGHVRVIVLICDVQGKRENIPDDVLKMACLHEVGHALGLAGHSTNNRDVMFFSESPTVWAALTKRDKATIARLYSDYPLQQGQQQFAATPAPQAPYAQPQYAPQPQYMPQQPYGQPQQMPPQFGMQPSQIPYPPQY